MVVAFRRNCHGPRKLVGRFRFEGVHCVTQIEHKKKRRTVKQGCIKPEARFRLPVWRAARASSRNGVECSRERHRACESRARSMVAAFYLASLLCASYVPAAPRGAPLRAASRVAAPMMMPIGVPKVAYRVPGSAYADWVSNLLPQRAARFSSSSIIVSFSIFAAKLSADTASSVVPLADDAHPSARCTGGSLQPLVPRAHPLPWSGDQ
jgi:hypothetical protein